MVLKYFIFFLLIVFLSILAIINDDIDFRKFDFKYTAYATMTFQNVKSIHITKEGINREIEASSIVRYDDVDYIKDVKVKIKKGNSIEKLEALEAINYKKKNRARENGKIEKEIFFKGDVIYTKDDNFTLKSNNLIYDLENRIISSTTDFILTQNDTKIVGSSFSYNLNSKEAFAEDINVTLYLKDKK